MLDVVAVWVSRIFGIGATPAGVGFVWILLTAVVLGRDGGIRQLLLPWYGVQSGMTGWSHADPKRLGEGIVQIVVGILLTFLGVASWTVILGSPRVLDEMPSQAAFGAVMLAIALLVAESLVFMTIDAVYSNAHRPGGKGWFFADPLLRAAREAPNSVLWSKGNFVLGWVNIIALVLLRIKSQEGGWGPVSNSLSVALVLVVAMSIGVLINRAPDAPARV